MKGDHDWDYVLLLLDVSNKLAGHPKYKWLLGEAMMELEDLATSPAEKERREAEALAAKEVAEQAAREAEEQKAAEAEPVPSVAPPRRGPPPVPSPTGDASNGRRV